MAEPSPASTPRICQADRRCERPPVFRARLEAAAGARSVLKRTELCAHHLGDTVYELATWAHDQGLEGQVTVLAVDQPRLPHNSTTCELAFGAIPIA
jgi:hypothetical protein